MKNLIDSLSQLYPILLAILWPVIILLKWKDFWWFFCALFSERPDVSSRRFISIASTLVLLWLCVYAQVHKQDVPEQVLVILLILIFISTGWATIPLIIKLIGMVKGMIPTGAPEKQATQEVNIEQTKVSITNSTDDPA